MTCNLPSPSKKAYSRCGGKTLSSTADNFFDSEGVTMDHHLGMLLKKVCPPLGRDRIEEIEMKWVHLQ
nr:hypothetical protein [Tanacetum cinerariifolium]